MIVDAHAHVFSRVTDTYPRETHPLFPAELDFSVERFIEILDRNCVDKAILVPLSHHDEYIGYALKKYKDRFAAIGVLNPTATDEGVLFNGLPASVVEQAVELTLLEEFSNRVERIGIQGLRIFRLGDPAVEKVEDLTIFPLLDFIEKQKYKVWYYGSPDQLPLLKKVLASLPQLTIVFNHLGFAQSGFKCDDIGRPLIETDIPPATLETVSAIARKYTNVYVLFSGHYAFSKEDYPYYDMITLSRQIYNDFGASRMMWATDSPWILEKPGYVKLMDITEHLLPGITGREKEKIMGDTALKLFFT